MPDDGSCRTKHVARCDSDVTLRCCDERHSFVCLRYNSYFTIRQMTKLKLHKLQKIPEVTETEQAALTVATQWPDT